MILCNDRLIEKTRALAKVKIEIIYELSLFCIILSLYWA